MWKRRRWHHGCGILAGFSSLVAVIPAVAATFCAQNATEVQSALTSAQANGQDDVINIVAGYYVLTTGLTFVSTEAHYLSIYGAYDDAACAVPNAKSAGATLDGNQLVRPLYIANPNSSVYIQKVNFAGGRPASGGSGGGLLIAATRGATIQYSTFFANRTTGSNALGGALYVNNTSDTSVFADNLVFGNRGTEVGGVVWLAPGGEAYINRNTIVGNTTDTLGDPGGLYATGPAPFNIGNNIIWNNAAAGGSDFFILAANTRKTNDIGIVRSGSTPGTVTGELAVDPVFAPCSGFLCFNFELARSSPLVDAGTNGLAPSGGPDFAGKPRQIGPLTDIGAYENDLIFQNGFLAP